MSHTDKGTIRALSRRGVRSDKMKPVEASTGRLGEPTMCDRCGASFARRTWRTDRRVPSSQLALARWIVCPACKQVERGVGYGRVDIRGTFAADHETDVRRRIASVATRAAARQPERRVISIEWNGPTLQVLTTSQKLAHRIARELEKAFRGRTTYRWSDDRTLVASWVRETSASARGVA
jgi:hypothetical protein